MTNITSMNEDKLREFYDGLTEEQQQNILDASWQTLAKSLCLWFFVSTMEFLAWITGHNNPWWTFFLVQGAFAICVPTIYIGVRNAKEMIKVLGLKQSDS